MKLPDRIYLQWYDEVEEKPIDINSGELTWCVDQINNSDAEYVLINKYKFLVSLNAHLLDACKAAEMFIKNGIELGYITLPDPELRDPANDTLPKIQAAITRSKKGRPPNANHPTE